MFVAALIAVAKVWGYSAIKNNGVLPFAATWMAQR